MTSTNALIKRAKQKKETWIKNIMRIQGKTREEAEKLYDKIYANLKERKEVENLMNK
jgi:hypothetical protein